MNIWRLPLTTEALLKGDWHPGYYYLSGPMSFRPNLNYDLFNAVANMLQQHDGIKLYNPAEHPLEELEEGKVWETLWGDYLARDVKIVADIVDGVVLLPGWEAARGSRLEVITATMVGKPVYAIDLDDWGLYRQHSSYLGEVMSDHIDQWYDRGL